MAEARKTESLTVRLTPETRARLEQAQTTLPYCPTATSIVERGIILALRELERMAAILKEEEAR
jgi:hypothetical protein